MDIDTLAGDIARAVSGSVVVLDRGDYPSRAVRVGEHCPILIRRHAVSFAISLPHEPRWDVRFDGDPSAVLPEVVRATAAWKPIVTMSDVAATLAGGFEVSWPGVAIPTEATLFRGAQHVGLFQEDATVRVVVWVGGSMRSRVITKLADLAGLSTWIDDELAKQAQVAMAAAKTLEEEAAARAAVPAPDFDRVMAAMRGGLEFAMGGGRCFSTYVMKNGALYEIQFDEGSTSDFAISESDLRKAIAEHAWLFREILERAGK